MVSRSGAARAERNQPHRHAPAKGRLALAMIVSMIGIGATAMAHANVRAAGSQTATATPGSGLHNGQTVRVHASGFMAGESLIVIECGNKGDRTGMGDCNLSNANPVRSDGAGTVDAPYTVSNGPFGSNNIVCSAQQPCAIQVTQIALSPTEIGQADISFGPTTAGGSATAARTPAPTATRPTPSAAPVTASAASTVPQSDLFSAVEQLFEKFFVQLFG